MAEKMEKALDDALDEAGIGLVDMKRTKKELKEESKEWKQEGPRDSYPWGLELRLENDALKKLGMDSLPSVGDEMKIAAIAVVESVAEEDRRTEDGKAADPRRHVCLQITKLGVKNV